VDLGGREHLFEFSNAAYEGFELRQGDLAVFSYTNGRLRIVQNLTVAQYYKLVSRSCCYICSSVFGEESPQVETLRAFRDRFLSPRMPLRIVVLAYYRAAPTVLRYPSLSRSLTPLIRPFLLATVAIFQKAGIAGSFAPFATCVPAKVGDYSQGGYPVLKKWLSYRPK
jgi:hypothetical protein